MNGLSLADLAALFGHFLMLSMLAIGGAIATAPEMHRYLVGQQGWLTDPQFAASIALAQAAPGPNVLFVAVLGYNVAGLAGVIAAMVGNLLPSTTFAFAAARYGHARRETLAVRAFVAGMAPLTIGLLLSTAWILCDGSSPAAIAVVAAAALVSWRTKLSPMWLIAAGAALGAAGWV